MEKIMVSVKTILGRRNSQQDRFVCKRFAGVGWFIAVLDGHGGHQAADFCAKALKILVSEKDFKDPRRAFIEHIENLHFATKEFLSGTTLSAVYFLDRPNKACFAILGDSPVIVFDKRRRIIFGPEHLAIVNRDETKEAIRRGGIKDGRHVFNNKGQGIQPLRVLGDYHMEGIVSRHPQIYFVRSPRWVAVASDGIFGFRTNGFRTYKSQLEKLGKQRINARKLVQWAVDNHTTDNVTAVVWNRFKVEGK